MGLRRKPSHDFLLTAEELTPFELFLVAVSTRLDHVNEWIDSCCWKTKVLLVSAVLNDLDHVNMIAMHGYEHCGAQKLPFHERTVHVWCNGWMKHMLENFEN